MSSVRMCDNCGNIFSESEPGWQTGRVATIGEDGIEQTVQQDRCSDCAVGSKSKPRVRPRLSAASIQASVTETASEATARLEAAKQMGEIVEANKIA